MIKILKGRLKDFIQLNHNCDFYGFNRALGDGYGSYGYGSYGSGNGSYGYGYGDGYYGYGDGYGDGSDSSDPKYPKTWEGAGAEIIVKRETKNV